MKPRMTYSNLKKAAKKPAPKPAKPVAKVSPKMDAEAAMKKL